MNAVFADTAYYNALLSPKDVLHEKAAEWLDVDDRPIVVTLTADHHFAQAGFTALLGVEAERVCVWGRVS